MPWIKEGCKMPIIDFGDTLEVAGIMLIFQIVQSAKSRAIVKIDSIQKFADEDIYLINSNINEQLKITVETVYLGDIVEVFYAANVTAFFD